MTKSKRSLNSLGGPTDPKLREIWQLVRASSFEQIHEKQVNSLLGRLTKKQFRAEDALFAKCILSEWFDYYGRFDQARDILREDAERIKPQLESVKEISARPVAIAVITRYAISLYRVNQFKDADDLLNKCEDTLRHSLNRTSGNSELLAQVVYCRGQIARQQSRYEAASQHFTAAIHFATESFHLLSSPGRGNLKDAYLRATHFVGKTLIMGFGWLYFNRGQLKNARPLVMSGKVFAEHSNDELLKAFGDMILGAIERSECGREPEGLNRAINLLEGARRTFETRNQRYLAVSEFFLAVAFWYRGDLDKSEMYAQAIERHRGQDRQWAARASIVQSRVACTRYKEDKNPDFIREARSHAKRAIAEGNLGNFLICAVEGSIALGEAEMAGGNREGSRKQFQEALDLSRKINNPKATAACHLHLARVYVQEHKLAEAYAQLDRWKALEPFVENGTLKTWANELEALLHHEDADFFISADSENLDYKVHYDRLRRFLEQRALKRAGGDRKKAAEFMGVSRQITYKWADPEKYGGKRKDELSE